MKAAIFLLATVALIGVSGTEVLQPRVHYGNVNFMVDVFLRKLNKILPDAIPVPDIDGQVKLTECFFIGLDNGIQRDGPATMVKQDDIMKFTSAFSLTDIGLKCNWKFGLFHGKATGTSAEVIVDTGIAAKTGEPPLITEFIVTKMDEIKVDIKGLTFAFNWLAEDIAEAVINDYSDNIIYFIEHQVKDVLQNKMNNITIS